MPAYPVTQDEVLDGVTVHRTVGSGHPYWDDEAGADALAATNPLTPQNLTGLAKRGPMNREHVVGKNVGSFWTANDKDLVDGPVSEDDEPTAANDPLTVAQRQRVNLLQRLGKAYRLGQSHLPAYLADAKGDGTTAQTDAERKLLRAVRRWWAAECYIAWNVIAGASNPFTSAPATADEKMEAIRIIEARTSEAELFTQRERIEDGQLDDWASQSLVAGATLSTDLFKDDGSSEVPNGNHHTRGGTIPAGVNLEAL